LAGGSSAMHRDILITNRDSVLRWIDQFQAELAYLRADLVAEPSEASEAALTAYFEQARDIRALWATQTTREGELLQQTGADLSMESVGDQVSRMFFGTMFRRKMKDADRLGKKHDKVGAAQGRSDQSSDNS